MPRNEKETRIRRWILKKTRIGPVLNSLLSSWSIQYRSSNSISISRQYRFFGQNREWRWKVRDRLDANQARRRHSSVKLIPNARPRQKLTVTLTSVSILVLERKRIDIETQRSHDHKVLWSVKSHDPIATTWSVSHTRKRRSDPLQWHPRRAQEEELQRSFQMVTWRLDVNTCTRRRSEEKIST